MIRSPLGQGSQLSPSIIFEFSDEFFGVISTNDVCCIRCWCSRVIEHAPWIHRWNFSSCFRMKQLKLTTMWKDSLLPCSRLKYSYPLTLFWHSMPNHQSNRWSELYQGNLPFPVFAYENGSMNQQSDRILRRILEQRSIEKKWVRTFTTHVWHLRVFA